MSVVSEQRREVGQATEATVHQVKVELPRDGLPADDAELERLVADLMRETERWAEACISARHVDLA